VATLTYSYVDSTVVLGPLGTHAEPHAYDLCVEHTDRLTVPRGWEVLRLELRSEDLLDTDDILALAQALRGDSAHSPAQPSSGAAGAETHQSPGSRRLRLVRDP
jgi:hypothetical protein